MTAGVAFPSDNYKTDVAMPVLDKSLVGKKVLLLVRRQDRRRPQVHGVQRGQSDKQPKRADAAGAVLHNPAFKCTLQIGKKGESSTTKLPPHQFGVDKKWCLAVKK